MQQGYDIFEKFPDNSRSWKTSVFGEYNAKRKLQDLAEHSDNEFVAVELQHGEVHPADQANYAPQWKAKGASR